MEILSEYETCGNKFCDWVLLPDCDEVTASWVPMLVSSFPVHAPLTTANNLVNDWNGMWLNRFLFRSLMLRVILGENDFKLTQYQIGAAKIQLFHEVFPDPPYLFFHLSEKSDSSVSFMYAGNNYMFMFVYKQ